MNTQTAIDLLDKMTADIKMNADGHERCETVVDWMNAIVIERTEILKEIEDAEE